MITLLNLNTMRTLLLLATLSFMGWSVTLGAQGALNIRPGTYMVMADATQLVLQDLDLNNDGELLTGQGAVHFTGNTDNAITGLKGIAFYDLIINKSAGKVVEVNFLIPPELPVDGPWSHNVDFKALSNRIILKTNVLLGPDAQVLNAGPDNFIVTLNARLYKEGVTAFTFPVGSDINHYTPLRIELPASGSLGVKCLPQVYTNGLTGNPFTTGVVDASWEIANNLQGNAAQMDLTAQWFGTDELLGFNGADCGIAQSLGSGDWDLAVPDITNKLGQDPYVIMRNGITLPAGDSAVFAVGSGPLMYPLRLSAQTYLQGAYHTGTGLMNDDLRQQQLIPNLEPYSVLPGFEHVGRGGGETVTNAVLEVNGPEAIVDWVFVELRTPGSSQVLETRSALIRRDGHVVDVDGHSPVVFRGRPSASYYFDVRHRNHLGVKTAELVTLYNAPVLIYDFSAGQNAAVDGVQANLNPGVWGMYGGNANSNRSVRYSGPLNDQNTLLNGCLGGNKSQVINNVYDNCDLNLNGVVRYQGTLNDHDFLLNTVLGTNKAQVILQPDF
jgi:hypothetical protein